MGHYDDFYEAEDIKRKLLESNRMIRRVEDAKEPLRSLIVTFQDHPKIASLLREVRDYMDLEYFRAERTKSDLEKK